MKQIFVISTILAVFLAGCDSECCNGTQMPEENSNASANSGDVVYVAPKANLALPQADLNRQSKTQLTLDGVNYSSDEDGTISSYIWTFTKPDGTTSTYAEEKPTFDFPAVGTYEICLAVKDNDQQTSNQSCREVVVEDQPVYLKPDPIVTILDAQGTELPSQDHLLLSPRTQYIFDGTKSYDPDNIDSDKIVAYHWKMVEYRKDANGYFFKYHYCNWPGQSNHSSCPTNGDYSKLTYRTHGGELHRTITLMVEDQDAVDGNNANNTRVYEYDTTLHNGEDLTKIPEHPARKQTL